MNMLLISATALLCIVKIISVAGEPTLYYDPISPPSRGVLLCARTMKIDLDKVVVELRKGEHKESKYVKMNPQHTVPTLKDGKFVLWESRAILGYLANEYKQSWYPKNNKERAIVDQRLYFDADVLYLRFANTYIANLFRDEKITDKKLADLNEALEWLDGFLKKSKWAAGDNMTIADCSLVSTVSTIEIFDHDLKPFKNVTEWLKNAKRVMKFSKSAGPGLKIMKEMWDNKNKKN